MQPFSDEEDPTMLLLKYQLCHLHFHGNVVIGHPCCACAEAEISIFSQGEVNQGCGSKCRPLCSFRAEHLMELLCSMLSKSSQQSHYHCCGRAICCRFLSKGWKAQSHGNGRIIYKESQSLLYFHLKPETEAGTGELEAKESICQLEHWMDASSIEE